MTSHQFDGHQFGAETVTSYDEDDLPIPVGLAATCSCGWRGADADPGMEGKGGYRGGTCHPFSLEGGDEAEAMRDAEQEWLDEHIADFEGAIVPLTLADQIRSVAEQLDALIEADKPMAALAAIRLSGGYFARQARDAALRASFLDHSWSQIGEALGISKQAAWERYGKSRPNQASM
ncbi:hypothetical protein AB0F46_39615 [Streptomyces sp. NPDC026665]|uniref:hypothetical protein n=1 Tax=Streptomyces sp. NPDC026665 TaxID=3154798 RepID=UPI0033DC7C56